MDAVIGRNSRERYGKQKDRPVQHWNKYRGPTADQRFTPLPPKFRGDQERVRGHDKPADKMRDAADFAKAGTKHAISQKAAPNSMATQ